MKKEVFYIETVIAVDENEALRVYNRYPKKFRDIFELFAIRKVGECVFKCYLKDKVNQLSVKECKKILSEHRGYAIGKDLEQVLEENNQKLVAFDQSAKRNPPHYLPDEMTF